MIILRDYQEKVLNEMQLVFENENKVVIAASPSSGKTIMMLKFIQDNPNSKFLILTHGTNILKNQWETELKKHDIDASDDPEKSRVIYGLPQGYNRYRNIKNIDYLIIDEAHEFTFANTVIKILEELNPKKVIYLTGTPSKFVKEKYKIIPVPGIDLIKAGHISDLYLGLISTNVNIEESEFNTDGDLLSSSDFKLENSVDSDLDSLLKSMQKRLQETELFKGRPNVRRHFEWAPTMGALHKTMIACKSINQAIKVESYFKRQGVNVISSNSENDNDTLNIQKFIDDPEIKVLVVVNRGILGFNMPDLVNVVDLTCSRNIDRTYQLFARVMRKNDRFPKKYFFKLTPERRMLETKFYTEASLMLLFRDFLLKFNGKNLNTMSIPVTVVPKKEKVKSGKSNKKSGSGIHSIDSLFEGMVSSANILNNIVNKIGEKINEYAYNTLGEIKHREFGHRLHNGYWTLEKCKEDALNYKTRNDWKKGSNGYTHAYINGWLEECCNHMELLQKPHGYWTKERCKQDALNYKSRSEWNKKSPGAYAVAMNAKILDECCSHMVSLRRAKGSITLEECKKEALKYKTRREWKKNDCSTYSWAKYNRLINKCCEHMVQTKLPSGYWTLENCKKEALKYKTKTEWHDKNLSSYKKAAIRGWLDQCCLHMKNLGGIAKKIKNLTTNKVYESLKEAASTHKGHAGCLCKALKNNTNYKGHYWAYVDEEEE